MTAATERTDNSQDYYPHVGNLENQEAITTIAKQILTQYRSLQLQQSGYIYTLRDAKGQLINHMGVYLLLLMNPFPALLFVKHKLPLLKELLLDEMGEEELQAVLGANNLKADERRLLSYLEGDQKGKMQWVCVLRQQERLRKLSRGLDKALKPKAEEEIALLEIAQGVYARNPFGIPQRAYLSPEHWWFSGQLEKCKQMLSDSGLTGSPLKQGKQAREERIRAFINSQLDFTAEEKPNRENLMEPSQITPNLLLYRLAKKLAKQDGVFKKTYKDQMRIIRVAARKLRTCPAIQVALVENGKLKIGGRGKRL